MADSGGVLIVAETVDGALAPISAELVGAGQRLMGGLGATLSAALLGSGLDNAAGALAALGPTLLQQPWLLLALLIYALNLGLAFFIQRPNLRRLIGVKAAPDDTVWRERARRQRYISYLMAGLVGVIGFLMSTKPSL